jgi:hypothetical protein
MLAIGILAYVGDRWRLANKSEAAPRLQSRPLSCVKIKELVSMPAIRHRCCYAADELIE